MSTEQARTIVDVRNHLRAIRLGRELVEQDAPEVATSLAPKVPPASLASEASSSKSASAGSRRLVVDSGSCVDIVGGRHHCEHREGQCQMHTPMRLDTTNGDVIASRRLEVLVRSHKSADAVVMKGVPRRSHCQRQSSGVAEQAFRWVLKGTGSLLL